MKAFTASIDSCKSEHSFFPNALYFGFPELMNFGLGFGFGFGFGCNESN
ncbi:hypothetical protein LGM57_02145 [Burkholderia cepacia]|nr:hypothetical protein [Burkholderia cepacia]MCA7975100.1 hypothetical protein [Burkholderia cepacia]